MIVPVAVAAALPRERSCSVGRTLAILSDPWTFLVLREMYLGARQFDQIRAVLLLPRTTLSDRLARLTAHGIVARRPYRVRPVRHDYRLTEMGLDLTLVMLALMRFGDEFLSADRDPPLELVHAACGRRCHPLSVCAACRESIEIHAVTYRDGPGAGTGTVNGDRRARLTAEPPLERGRPSSVSRALAIIGNRWSFLVLREAFFGVRRFDAFQARLDIASNILADRLGRLVEGGIFSRMRYQTLPPRHEYQLTARGRALYLPLIEMLRWGDRWLAPAGPPLILTHRACRQDMSPVIVCDHCRAPLAAHDMRYRLRYAPPPGGALPPALICD